ncbi:hypothetical protein U9M48_002811 [Paspalum notatum var. saurae]|uniref:Uncharacterized protein n=1 Tax=Paspalum notatum var. saurae TaxID=547442 RepID=A0AAQ3PRI6_PASNO
MKIMKGDMTVLIGGEMFMPGEAARNTVEGGVMSDEIVKAVYSERTGLAQARGCWMSSRRRRLKSGTRRFTQDDDEFKVVDIFVKSPDPNPFRPFAAPSHPPSPRATGPCRRPRVAIWAASAAGPRLQVARGACLRLGRPRRHLTPSARQTAWPAPAAWAARTASPRHRGAGSAATKTGLTEHRKPLLGASFARHHTATRASAQHRRLLGDLPCHTSRPPPRVLPDPAPPPPSPASVPPASLRQAPLPTRFQQFFSGKTQILDEETRIWSRSVSSCSRRVEHRRSAEGEVFAQHLQERDRYLVSLQILIQFFLYLVVVRFKKQSRNRIFRRELSGSGAATR